MVRYPHIQQLIHDEIRNQFGASPPSIDDSQRLPYTEATILEIQRIGTFAPMGMPHTNLENDVIIDDYVIPKNSTILANIWAIHTDTKTWQNPHSFDPTNFLGKDGKVKDNLMPFSCGRKFQKSFCFVIIFHSVSSSPYVDRKLRYRLFVVN